MINRKAAVTSAGFILLMAVAAFWAVRQVPAEARIPTHFDLEGVPDGWMRPIPAFFLMPGLASLLWLLALVMPRLGQRAANLARSPGAYGVLWTLPVMIGVPLQLVILAPLLGRSWDTARLMPAVIGAVFILVGNVMGKIPPNPFFGVRTPWTLADDRVWDQTHRFAGWLFVGGGFVILGGALMLPAGDAHKIALLVALIAAGLSVLESWLLSHQRR